MINFTTPNAYRKIEYYLYNYDFIDAKVNILKDQVLDSEYNQNYARWIKNKSSSLEDLVIKNMDIERRILKLKKWKGLIDNIVKEYAEKNQEFYNFIHLKYFIKLEPSEIEETVIYGHNMRSKAMFSELGNYLDRDFYNSHRIIKIYTPNQNYIRKILIMSDVYQEI